MLRVFQNISKFFRSQAPQSSNAVSGSLSYPQQLDEASTDSEGAASCVSVTCPEQTHLTNLSWLFPVHCPVVWSSLYHEMVPNMYGFNHRQNWESDGRQYSQFEGLGLGTAVVVAIQLCRALSAARFPSDDGIRLDLKSHLLTKARLLPVFPPRPQTARSVLSDSNEASPDSFSVSFESSSEEEFSPNDDVSIKLKKKSKDCKNSCSQLAAAEDGVIPALEKAISQLDEVQQKTRGMVQNMMGIQYAKMGDYTKAVEHFQSGIKFGYSKAQFNLGICYELGKGVVVDMKKTVELYRQAAHQGHPLALYNLAVYNYHGYGIPKNVKEGIELMEMAADSGVIPAHSFLGSYYLQTKSRDIYKAVHAEDTESQYLLGLCYEQGLGVRKNSKKAARLFHLSAEAGYPLALYNMGLYYEAGLGGLLQNKVHALELYAEASQCGLILATEKLKLLSPPAIKKTSHDVEAVKVLHLNQASDGSQNNNFHMSSSEPNFTAHKSCKEELSRRNMSSLSYLSLILPSLLRTTPKSEYGTKPDNLELKDINSGESTVNFHIGADEENGLKWNEDCAALNRPLVIV